MRLSRPRLAPLAPPERALRPTNDVRESG